MHGILYSIVGRRSVRLIAAGLSDLEIGIFWSRGGRWGAYHPPTSFQTLIRFGSVALAPPAERVYNQAAAIAIASNKRHCRVVLEKAGIAIPERSTRKYPVVGRRIKHRAGRGFWLCNDEEEMCAAVAQGARYFSRFYPKKNEYRVHVAHSAVLYVQEKAPREDEEYKRDWLIWNHAINDFMFHIVRWSYWPLNVILLAIKAVETVGLDYGAVDIMANPSEDGFPPAVVCEINTGMSIDSNYSATMYQDYFRWLIEEHPEEPLKPVGSKPQGYAFKKILKVLGEETKNEDS